MKALRLRISICSSLVAGIILASGCSWFGATRESDARRAEPQQEVTAVVTPSIRTVPTPAKMLALDFGKGGIWPGFSAAPGAPNVRVTGASFGRDDRGDFPDPLIGDYAHAARVRVTLTGLSRGSFRAAVVAQNVIRGMVSGRDFQIRANGIVVVDERISAEKFFSRNGFFFGEQFDDLPGTDWWDRYVEPVTPWRRFEFESNGRLTLELDNSRLYALILAPKAAVSEEEFEEFITSTQAARKGYFLFHEFELAVERPSPRFRPLKEQTENGYVMFSRGWERDVSYHTVPVLNEIVTSLEASGTPGERVPVTFSIRTLRRLAGLKVSVSDLAAKSGAGIAAEAVTVAAVRYKLKREEDCYRIVPELLAAPNNGELPGDVTKRWWLTVSIPEDAPAGLYRGTVTLAVENAPDAQIDLVFRVYPFRLSPPQASIGVWYDDPRVQGYCTGLLGGVTGTGASNVEHEVPRRPGKIDKAAETYRVSMLAADIASLAEHGFNALTVPVPRVVSVSGKGEVKLDFSSLEPYARLLNEHSMNTEFAGQTYLLTVSRQIMNAGAGGKTIEEYSELHQKAYVDAVRRIANWWNERDVKLLAHAVDEPRERGLNPLNRSLAGTIYYVSLLKTAGAMPTTVTTMRDVQDGVPYRPIVEAVDVVQPHPSPHNADTVKYARGSGKPLRYFSSGGFRRYDFGFYIWSQKPEGYWQWHFDLRGFSFNPFWERDVGYVVCPSSRGPVPTLRYERAAQGIYDYRYALTLEQYILRAEKVPGEEAEETVKKARRVLSDIKRRCPRWTLDKKWRPVRIDNVKLSQWRKSIAESIIACKSVTGGEKE
ncbi:MAG: hypothetical protein ACYTAN_08830 [Planctomycetota bacterium]